MIGLHAIRVVRERSAEPFDEGDRIGDCPEHSTLHLNHLDRRQVITEVGRPAAIRQQ